MRVSNHEARLGLHLGPASFETPASQAPQGDGARSSIRVIASEAKQSIARHTRKHGLLRRYRSSQ
ncbi:hypothetical protein ACVILL_004176 [Bradyrhizobium sp. USDA 3364]